jgi:hypothetical protein
LLNKIDYVSEEDLQESIDFSEKAIEDSLERPGKIFPLSAKLALDAKLSGSDGLLQKSLLPEFEKELGDFLMKEKGRTLLVSVLNSLLRSLSQAIFQLELEMKSLSIPLEELKSKLAAFDAKKKEVLSQRHDFDVLLDGELKRLIKKDLDEELGDFKRKLASRLEEEMEVFYEKNKHLSTRRLNAALENFVIESVKNAYNAWWAEEDKRLATAFENTCNRFIANINETVDALYRFHSELFDIPFESFGNEELWRVKPGFYYKFKEEAVMLELITKSFTLSLPRFIGSRVVLKKMREYMQEMIDRQGGRVRFDFVDRLTKAKEDFRKEAVSRIDATLDSISAATRKGMGQRQQGEAAPPQVRGIPVAGHPGAERRHHHP